MKQLIPLLLCANIAVATASPYHTRWYVQGLYSQPNTIVLPSSTTGQPILQELAPIIPHTLNNPVFSSNNLPSGLNLSPQGILSGTPLMQGSYNITININTTNQPPMSYTLKLEIMAPSCTIHEVSSIPVYKPPTLSIKVNGTTYDNPNQACQAAAISMGFNSSTSIGQDEGGINCYANNWFNHRIPYTLICLEGTQTSNQCLVQTCQDSSWILSSDKTTCTKCY